MSTFAQTDVGVLMGEFDISGDHNAVALEMSVDLGDDTTYGDSARNMKPLLMSWSSAGEGLQDYAAAGLDVVVFPNLASANTLLTVAPENTGLAAGNIAYFAPSLESEYSPVQDEVGVLQSFRWRADGDQSAGLIRGTIMLNAQPSASGNGTSRQLGAVSATQTVYLGLHFIAASAAITVTLDSDDNSGMTSATTQITAVAQSAPGTQFLSQLGDGAGGAITDTWWRIDFTTAGGTFDIIAIVGIQ